MNLYTLKFLHDYHIDQQEKFNTECKVFGIQQSPLRSLVVIYTLMAAIETVGVLLLATTILPAYHDRFGNHFRACVYNFGYSLMALHCFWVCLTFKLIQGLALSNKSSSPLQVPVVAMGRQVEISNGEMSTVRVGK